MANFKYPSYVDQPGGGGFGSTAQYTVEGGIKKPLFGPRYQAEQAAAAAAAARAASPGAFPGAPTTPTGFQLSPRSTTGQGPFGAVPGQLGLPNPVGDLGKLYPGLTDQNAQVSKNVSGELMGELSPETQAAIQDAAARFGVTSGMPGAGLVGHRTLRDLGLATEGLQQQGLKDYLSSITGIKQTQTVSPELQNEIATQNALNRAAPDPTQAATYAKQLFDQYLSRMRGPGGGTTGTNPGAYAPGVAGAGGGFKLPGAAPGGYPQAKEGQQGAYGFTFVNGAWQPVTGGPYPPPKTATGPGYGSLTPTYGDATPEALSAFDTEWLNRIAGGNPAVFGQNYGYPDYPDSEYLNNGNLNP